MPGCEVLVGFVAEPEAHQSPYWSMPMLGAVPRQPFFRLEGLGLLQTSRPGSTLVASCGSSPIAGTAMTGGPWHCTSCTHFWQPGSWVKAAASAAMGHP